MTGLTASARIALVAAIGAAAIGLVPAQAHAAYTARVEAGTLTIKGNAASDKLALRLQPGAPGTLQVDVDADGTADFSFDRSTFTAVDVEAGGGDDEIRVDQSGGAFTDEAVTMNGGAGDDTMIGGAGAETFLGGTGEDFADGNIGADRAAMGGGDDTFQWDPGDGSDTVDGNGGNDRLDFNGSNVGEQIAFAASAGRVQMTRNIGSITMDLDGIERVQLRSLGGSDTTTVGDLVGTELKLVDVDLDAIVGGGDGATDTVIARGTEGADKVGFASPDGRPVVTGLGAQTRVTGGEAALDDLVIQTLGGADTATMTVGVTGEIPLHVDGGDGDDTARYNGTAGPDELTIARDGTEVAVQSTGSALFETTTESLIVSGLDGGDTIAALNGIGALTSLTVSGGDGDDDLRGGDGADTIDGGRGNDSVDGNIGADQATLGPGDDRFQWDPGDGSDTVEGNTGDDRLDFNGSNAGEQIELTANGDRLRLTRNIASITMDLDGVEATAIRLLGGADVATVGDLSPTDMKTVDVDLNGFDGGGDGAADTVIARGTDGADEAAFASPDGRPVVTGLGALTRVSGGEAALDSVVAALLGGADTATMTVGVTSPIPLHADGGDGDDVARYEGTPAADQIAIVRNGTEVAVDSPPSGLFETAQVESLVVSGRDGNDVIAASNGLATLTALTIAGGDGDDDLRGGDGADTIDGGRGNDSVDGNIGADQATLGPGDDRFQWDPGDGSDTVEGNTGDDRLDFNGSNAGEQIELTANGDRLRLTRNIASITMDLGGIEHVALRMLGGADVAAVGDLGAAGVTSVDVDLAAFDGGGDGAQDTVVLDGTARRDVVQVTRTGDAVSVAGLPAAVGITGSEGLNDTLRIQTLGGNDDVTVDPNAELLLTPVIDLGADE